MAIEFVRKFGRNAAVSTSFVPICTGGVYQMPQVSGATALRIKAGNANDTADGTGARKVMIIGLDATGAEVSEELTTAGASAGANSVNSYIRLYRAYVTESGTYATTAAGSHAANVVIENAAGTADWMTLVVTNYPRSQSLVGFFTIPLGYTGTMEEITFSVDSAKTADIMLVKRENILDAAAPYSAMRDQQEFTGVIGIHTLSPSKRIGTYPELTDVGFMAKVPLTAADVSVEFMMNLTNSG